MITQKSIFFFPTSEISPKFLETHSSAQKCKKKKRKEKIITIKNKYKLFKYWKKIEYKRHF